MSELRPSRTAWFNCQAGVAGDMTLAALVDAGADADAVAQILAGLGVDGYALTFERVQRCGVGATWANVVVTSEPHDHDHHDHDDHDHHDHHRHDDHEAGPNEPHPGSVSAIRATSALMADTEAGGGHVPHRPVREIYALLDAADLPDRVRDRARAVFQRLAAVEGAIHGIDPAEVELHEVGAVDSIIDVVGVCAALETLDIGAIRCSPIALGTGTVRSAHGLIPNPAPATVALLRDARAPTVGLATTLEVTTPTGAALMATLASGFGAPPPMVIDAVGYGAGTADTPGRANVVQVVVGEAVDALESTGTPVILLEANLDDVTGEVLAAAVSTLLAAGAHDAWITPIVMKKGRPAHTVSVLCDPTDSSRLRGLLVEHTGTLGVRASTIDRWPQRRTAATVDVDGHPIAVKVTDHRIKVEFDDAAHAATALGRPVAEIISRAEQAARALDA